VAGFAGWTGAVAALIVILATAALVRRATLRFGGITGDVLGAAVEIGTAAALLTFAAWS
jgi:adenosylcobinamide-GDP ribazoletransferase